MLILAKVPW